MTILAKSKDMRENQSVSWVEAQVLKGVLDKVSDLVLM